MSASFKCPNCSRKLFSYEPGAQKYGSMVGMCKYCNSKYLDPRYKEAAITGIPKRELGYVGAVVLLLFGGFMAWRGYSVLSNIDSYFDADMLRVRSWVFVILGILFVVAGLIEAIFVVTGLKKKKMEKIMAESVNRLKNESYVWDLVKLGVINNPEAVRNATGYSANNRM
ncbi:MAG: hypothetical protein K6F84_09030 [Lachnospiraceae bacterium]|nr:hypothetical protein [Lachnospiraceae bacterium]